tara:strand:- start:2271 stop:3575 length:1305 start_codon:yes stop_codon:yes gene_type:complete
VTKTLRVGVAGLGFVGAATVKLLQNKAPLLRLRCTRDILVTAVSARDKSKDRGISMEGIKWHDNPLDISNDEHVDLVVETIGGSDGVAKEVVEKAIANGKHVVTANKALIAQSGTILAEDAEQSGVALAFEAAVAGGIPILKALREGLSANRIDGVYGILNGTCNYILTCMRETGKEFEEVLQDAQKLGYAEEDPSFDLDGIDAAHKLAILSSLAFGLKIDFGAVHVEGIRHITLLDIEFAQELGYRIKLLGITHQSVKGIEQRVHPCMVPLDAPIAHIEDVFNAVVVHGDQVGTTMYEGRGAGAGPTSSAIVADIVDIALGRFLPAFGLAANDLKTSNSLDMLERVASYYVRFTVIDRPGVFAEIATALRDNNVSMEKIIQRGRAPGEPVRVVLTTHETKEKAILKTIQAIDQTDAVVEPTRMIRIEPSVFLS